VQSAVKALLRRQLRGRAPGLADGDNPNPCCTAPAGPV